ncbi:TIR domain-containing protein [Streptomyces flavidovirens]|uniref:toll/interleukin-1 receptor domain-containing protein n=1 Tax=Streptomyces flavidovirens TaxID=67298 RepID=UPI0033BDB34D
MAAAPVRKPLTARIAQSRIPRWISPIRLRAAGLLGLARVGAGVGERHEEDRRYDVFISYSHAWDREVARALQSQLHRFAKPWYRPRSITVFRDETDLSATPGLWREIERALSRADWLVVMASPRAAASPWVRKEIQWWLDHRSPNRILIAWTDGRLAWDSSNGTFDWSATDALPREVMADVFGDQPRWVDLRWLHNSDQLAGSNPQLLECAAEFVAPLTGKSKAELIGEHVRQHRRTVRWVQSTIAVLITLVLTAVLGGVTAYTQRNTAREQTLTAQSRRLVAEALSIRDTRPGLARQLLVHAYRMSPTTEAVGALLGSASMPRVVQAAGYSRTMAYSGDGNVLAVVAENGVKLYASATLEVLASLDAHDGHTTAVAFSRDGKLLATGEVGGEVRLFDLASIHRPRPLGSVSTGTGALRGLLFSPHAPLLVYSTADSAAGVLDVRDTTLPVPTSTVPDFGNGLLSATTGLAISLDGDVLATTGEDDSARVWNLSESGRLTPLAKVSGPVHAMALSPDGYTLALGGEDGTVRLWDVAEPARAVERGRLHVQSQSIQAMAFSAQGTTLATGDSDGMIRLWDMSDPLRPQSGALLTGHTSWVSHLAFSPDGHTLASVGSDGAPLAADGSHTLNGTVRLWPVSGAERSSSFAILPSGGTDNTPSFSGDSRLLAAGHPTGIWEVSDQWHRRVGSVRTFNQGGQAVAFSPQGRLLATGVPAVLWDVAHPTRPRNLTPGTTQSGGAQAVGFSPTRPVLATAQDSVQLWDISHLDRPVLMATLPRSETSSQALAFRNDGRILAALDPHGAVILWDVDRPSRAAVRSAIKFSKGKARSLAFSADGRTLLVGDSTGSVTVWNVSDVSRPERGGVSERHTSAVTSLGLHPKKPIAASGGEDGSVRLWDASGPAGPVEIATLGEEEGGYRPTAVSFSPNGKWLAAGNGSGLRLWSVDETGILQRLCADSPRITPDQWTQYLPEYAYDPPCAQDGAGRRRDSENP